MDKQDLKQLTDWHQHSLERVGESLESSLRDGLSDSEVAQRQQDFGPNSLPVKGDDPWWKRLLRQFNNLLIYVLIVAAVLAGALAEWLDMAVIMAVVVVNTLIGFVQEGKAEKALNAIQGLLSSKATVTRNGIKSQIPASELVPGDLVHIEPGDRVPADIRLVKSKNLAVQEASLTGESAPVEKYIDPVRKSAPLAERSNMAYSGTLVVQGQAVGLVTATGSATELGRINKMLSNVTELTTPLLRQMSEFARYLTIVILLVAAVVFILGILRGNDPTYLFMAVVSLIVAAIPEGLPTILTVALAIGVTRMAQRRSIIRRLPAVETLGAVSVICSDKTGTLTRNEMMVASVVTPQGSWEVTGTGYAPEGELQALDTTTDSASPEELIRAGGLCNDSALEEQDSGWMVTGDPMEGALLVLGRKTQAADTDQTRGDRIDALPFDSSYKYMATLHEQDSQRVVYVKGAPERILELCENQLEEPLETWQKRIDDIAAKGQRVLGFARKLVNKDTQSVNHDTLQNGLEFLGITGLIDPPRQEALESVRLCRQAGINVKMITGDHGATALAIGKQLELEHTDRAITGKELDELSDEKLADIIQNVDVFARTTPEHKLRLVMALQQKNNVVAMTGDGVNDSPALKRADVGIAMGKNGTEAAREASEMVLTDDNFASIVSAVKEGRTVYDNLKKAIGFLLPVNGGESLAIILALLFALTLPILPLQILWVNMVSSIALALALAFEASERDVMKRPPRKAGEPLIDAFLLWRIIFVSALFTIGIFSVFQWGMAQGFDEAYARTMAVNTLVAMEVWYLFSVRYLRRGSLFTKGIKGTRPVLIAVCLVFVLQLAFTYLPFMQVLFQTQGLSIAHGFVCVAIGILVFMVLEVEKWIRQRL